MVWKLNKAKDPLDRNIFPNRSIIRPTRSFNSLNATQPAPGNKILAANLMARTWNSATEVQTVTTVGAAKLAAQKWACNLLVFCHYLTFSRWEGKKSKYNQFKLIFICYLQQQILGSSKNCSQKCANIQFNNKKTNDYLPYFLI